MNQIKIMRNNSPDDFQTPPSAIIPLLPYLKKEWKIWECAAGKGQLVEALKNRGFDAFGTDLSSGQNFLNWQPPSFDCVITNPPYSIKEDFLERGYSLKKPFAFLLPLTTFEGRKRQALMQQNGIEVLFLKSRVNFTTPTGIGKSAWFATAWFCKEILPKELNWEERGKQATL